MNFKKLKYLFLYILLLRIILAVFMQPGADEAYYFAYTLHPDLSYFDHPPMVALFAGLIPRIFNWISSFSLRLLPILMFSLAVYVSFLLAAGYFNREKAYMAAAVFTVVPMFFISGTLILPDAPLIFFWLLGLYMFKKTMDEPELKNWLLFGAVAGLGLLSKYTAGFLFVGMFSYLVINREKRKFLLSSGPYTAVLAGIIVFIPVIIWNIHHDFISFSFQSGRVGAAEIEFRYFYQSLFGQMGYLLPFFFFPALYFSVKSLFNLRKDAEFWGTVFSFGALPLFFFIFASLFKRVLPHWPVIAYITLVLPVASFYSELKKRRPLNFNFYAVSHIFLVTAAVIITVLQINTGIIMNREVPETGKAPKKDVRDITVDIIGWNKLSSYLKENYSSNDYFVFTYKWYLGGQLSYALKGKYDVLCLADIKDARGFSIWQNQARWLGKDGLYICTSKFYRDPAEKYSEYFEKIVLEKKLPVYRAGKRVKVIYIYRCTGFKKAFS